MYKEKEVRKSCVNHYFDKEKENPTLLSTIDSYKGFESYKFQWDEINSRIEECDGDYNVKWQ